MNNHTSSLGSTSLRRAALIVSALAMLVPLAVASPADAIREDAWMSGIEGGWVGDNNSTPLGRMGFAMLFERESDGSYHSHSAMSQDTWIDLRFFKGEGGVWLLEQRAALEGMGEQGSVLVPVAGTGDRRRWVDPERPDFLAVDLGLSEDELLMDVTLRGHSHAQFKLQRVRESAELENLRSGFAAARKRTKQDVSIFQFASSSDVPAAIQKARQAVAERPEDAGAHIDLSQALIDVITADPSQGAMYAGELLSTLKQAKQLDPQRPEAYEGLIGYYVSAPPIAGGSIAKAKELLAELVALDPARGAAMRQMVEARQAGAANAGG